MYEGVESAQAHRISDLAARYGGEEFAVIAPDTDAAGMLRLVESIRTALEVLDLPHDTSPLGRISLSIGVAELVPGDGTSPESRAPGTVLDQDFITQSCTDFAVFADAIALTTRESIEGGCGITRALIEEAAVVYLAANGVVVTWGLGTTPSRSTAPRPFARSSISCCCADTAHQADLAATLRRVCERLRGQRRRVARAHDHRRPRP